MSTRRLLALRSQRCLVRTTNQKLIHAALTLCVEFFDTADAVALTQTCATLHAALHDNDAVAARVWATVAFFGPYPFGVRSCATAFGLSGRMLVPALLETLTRKQGHRMRSLTVSDCLFNDACLAAVARYCTTLTSLDVSNSEHRHELNMPVLPSAISSVSLVALKHVTTLTDLRIRHCHVTDKGLAVLASRLKNLSHIDLSCCKSLREPGFLELLNLPKLSFIALRGTGVTDYAVGNLIVAMEGLLHLDISYCPRVTNQSLVIVSQLLRCKMPPHPGPHTITNPLLFKLLASCVSSTTAPLGLLAPTAAFDDIFDEDAIAERDRSTASAFGDGYSDAEFADHDARLPASAASLLSPVGGRMVGPGASSSMLSAVDPDSLPPVKFRLQNLYMKSVNVNYIALSCVAKFFPDLRQLDLSSSRHLNTLSFREMALSCTMLESLNFRNCPRVDDESLIHVFSSASRYRLQEINLQGCNRLTDKSMTFLLTNCTHLKALNIVDCSYISNNSVTKLTGLLMLTRLDVGSTSSLLSFVNPDVTPLSVNVVLNARACGYHLRVLRLYATAADDLVLSVISQRCHNLRELYVQDQPTVTKHRPTKDIVWDSGPEDRLAVTSRGLYHLSNGVCTSLTRLQLVSCDAIDYEGVQYIVNTPPPRLRDLQFQNCKGIGVRAHQLLGAGSDFGRTQLRRLSLCDDVCSVVLEGVRAVLTGCLSLELLELRNCKLLPPLESPETQAMLRTVPRLPPSVEWFPGSVSVTPARDLLW